MAITPRKNMRGTRAHADLPFGCRCGERWAGSVTCHCGSGCHRTFAGITSFDGHRVRGQCVDPRTIPGLSLATDRAYRCWYGRRRVGDDRL